MAIEPPTIAEVTVRDFVKQLPNLVRTAAVDADLDWPTSGNVYQYTSIQTLLSMICPGRPYVDTGSGQLSENMSRIWATAAPYLNDSREFNTGRDVLIRAAERAKLSSPTDVRFIDIISEAIAECEGLDVFCACFSKQPDHLGQWRGYGDYGKGCALGFDLSLLENTINGLGSWLIYGGHAYEAAQSKVSDRLLQEIIEMLRYGEKKSPEGASFLAGAKSELKRLLPAVFLLFKDGAFSDEFEYRVVYSDLVAPGYTAPRCFRQAGPAIVPFVRLEFNNGSAAPLREVRLGPAAQFKPNPDSLRFLLDRAGLTHVAHSCSDIPFVPRG